MFELLVVFVLVYISFESALAALRMVGIAGVLVTLICVVVVRVLL
jgi:hypothetical protein